MPTPDLLSTDFYADIDGMHAAFRSMRAAGPVWRDEQNELWAVAHHAALIHKERSLPGLAVLNRRSRGFEVIA